MDDRYDRLLGRLEKLKERLQELPQWRAEKLKALEYDAAHRQRDHYLSMFRIDKARLKSLTPQDIAMLESWDIDTADDLMRPDVELPKTVSVFQRRELLAWAEAVAGNFRFDAARGLDPADLRALDESMYAAQRPLMAQLDAGTRELRELSEDIHSERVSAELELADARDKFAKLSRELE